MNNIAKRNTIEKIKNVLLVVLFLSAILLLYFFWNDMSIKDFSLQDLAILEESARADKLISAEEVLVPAKMVLSHGEGVYTILTDGKQNYWNNLLNEKKGMVQCIKKFAQTENMLVEEIGKELYDSNMAGESVKAIFDFYIPFNGFCDKFKIKKATGGDNIDAMTEIGYSLDSRDSLFVYDAQGGKYYRMVSGAQEKQEVSAGEVQQASYTIFEQHIKLLESENEKNYYPINVFLGTDSKNTTLIPVALKTNEATFSYGREFYPEEREKINEAAKDFFGDGFDFVRKIEEASGAVVYMYGYGEKVLIADIDGSLEYKEEAADGNAQTKYFEALDEALRFISAHGGFKTLSGQEHSIFLKDVVIPPDRKRNLRFVFEILTAGEEIYYQSGDALEVEVSGSQIVYYKRNFIEFQSEETVGESRETFPAVNMLAQNHEYIYENLLKEGMIELVVDKEKLFDQIAEQVSSVRYGYVRPDEGNQVYAAWIVSLHKNKMEFYFGMDDAEPLGYGMK